MIDEINGLGIDPGTGRHLFALAVPDPSQIPDNITLQSKHFICFIACNGFVWVDQDLYLALERLLCSGAIYFCAWGPDCERIHDMADRAILDQMGDVEADSLVPTTWHEQESLGEALWFAARTAAAAPAYEKSCSSFLAISVGHRHWYSAIADLLRNPARLDQIELE